MAILGLMDSEAYAAVRFKNWRRAILEAFPNGSAPLTALMQAMDSEDTDDPEFDWFERSMPTQTSVATGAYASDATQVTVTDAVFRPGHIIKNLTESHGEVMKVTAVDNTGLILTVLRGNWGTAYASSGATDVIGIIGNSNAEGSGAPTSLTYAPTPYENYTQIWKSPFELTGTAMKTSVKYDPAGPWPDKIHQGLNHHSIEMEKSWMFGRRGKFTDATTGNTERTTGGIRWFLEQKDAETSATSIYTPSQNTLTMALWEGYLEQVFRVTLNGAQEKLALCGSGFLTVLNKVIKNNAVVNLVPKAEVFGMKIWQYETPHGTLYLKTHPLLSQITQWRYNCFILDMAGIKFRPLTGRDTKHQTHIEANDADQRKDQFITEGGLEVNHPEAMLLIEGATTAGT